MPIRLDQRLTSIANLVDYGKVADVGCDHGYLAIHLVQTRLASQVYASDIRPAPLDSARKNGDRLKVSRSSSFSSKTMEKPTAAARKPLSVWSMVSQ